MTILNELTQALEETLKSYEGDTLAILSTVEARICNIQNVKGALHSPDYHAKIETEEFAKRLLPHLTSLFINNFNPELRDDHFPDY